MPVMSFIPRIGMAFALCGVLSACARSGFDPSAAEADAGASPPRAEDSGPAEPVEDGGSVSPATGGEQDGAVGASDAGPVFVTDSGPSDRDGGRDASTDSGMTDAGPMDAGQTGDDAGPMFVCTTINACSNARILSAIRGDSEAQVSSASGQMSEWVAVTIADIGGVFNADGTIRARITLTSPAGSNYDLFVHQPSEAGGNAVPPKDCSVAPLSSQSANGDDVIALSWQDVTNFFGETAGDGLMLSIEIRHVSGPCDKPWSLRVQGNTL
jgi:hypothetical protein